MLQVKVPVINTQYILGIVVMMVMTMIVIMMIMIVIMMTVRRAWYLAKHSQVCYFIAFGLYPVRSMAGVHSRNPGLLTPTHLFSTILCCLPGELLRSWRSEMRNQSTNSDSAEDTLWFHSPHFSKGVKRPLCWRKQNPKSNSPAPSSLPLQRGLLEIYVSSMSVSRSWYSIFLLVFRSKIILLSRKKRNKQTEMEKKS